jgi:energy-converting hydrogenase Eha subunit C
MIEKILEFIGIFLLMMCITAIIVGSVGFVLSWIFEAPFDWRVFIDLTVLTGLPIGIILACSYLV